MTTILWRHDIVPGTPEENMATDEALLRAAQQGEGAGPVVRVYTWNQDCVSIGRLQNEATVQMAYPGLLLVRRPTGGRAVRHGDDLCISVIARLSELPGLSSTSIASTHGYLAGALVKTFCALGTPAELGRANPERGQMGNVDCFAVACRCDVIEERTGQKLAGCAQRRVEGAVLQQMSLPRAYLPATEDAFLACVQTMLSEVLQDVH